MRVKRFSRQLRPLEEGLLATTLILGIVFVALSTFRSQLYFILDEPAYLALHTVLEIASILVSFAVFIVNWEASKQNHNAQSLFIANGFLAVAVVDVIHTLTVNGTLDFVSPFGTDKSIYFWLFARYWAAGILLASVLVLPDTRRRLLTRYVLAAANLGACVAVFVVVSYFPTYLPSMYVDGVGLTPLKVGLEYGVVLLYLTAAVLSARRYRATGDGALVILVTALVVSSFSELSFTLYTVPSDVYNILGHAYKVVAYYLIFRALLVSSVERPYVELREANENLERTVTRLNDRTRELDALDEVALTLSSTLRPEELLPAAMEKIMAVMQAESGAIFLVPENSDELKLVAWKGLKAGFIAQYQAHSVKLRQPGSSYLATEDRSGSGASLLERSLGGDAARVAPLHSCVCAPVSTKGETLGSIAMVARPDRLFSATDGDLLTAVGYQLGLAIENSRLYERTDERLRENLLELQQAERKARFLSEAASLLASSMELSKVLEMVARKSAEVVGDWCAIYLLDERERALRLDAVYHADEDELHAIRRLLNRRPVRDSEALLWRVARRGEPLLVTGEALQAFSSSMHALVESVEEVAVVHRLSPSSAVIAPMRARGRTVGVLVVMETHTNEVLGESEVSLVTELGDRAGVAIENSQLFQESQAQRRHLEAVISQMVDGVVIADAAGRAVVVNDAALAMTNGQISRLVEQAQSGSADQVDKGTSSHSTALISRALAGELLTGEEILVAGEAGERILSASVTPVREPNGEIGGAVVVLRDVTAEREIDRMKDEFVATVSHELRTPITAVLGYTDLLLRGLRGPLTVPQSDALTAVRNAGGRLLSLIEDLLDISKLEAGKQDLVLDVVNVQSAVDRALTGIAFMASTRGVRLVQSIPRNLPPVLADDDQVQRILGNLLSNAVKFTPPSGTVTVSAAPSVGDGRQGSLMWTDSRNFQWVIITVSDTGVGIPEEMHEKIWEKFQQVDSSSTRPVGGTGLGLAITKALVTLHGGSVWVESEGVPGKGSTFGFTLPAVSVPAREVEQGAVGPE